MLRSTSKPLQGLNARSVSSRQLAVPAGFPTRHHGRRRALLAIGTSTGAGNGSPAAAAAAATMGSGSLVTRPMHTTSSTAARLVQGHISIIPGATMQLPPTVPIPVDPSTPSAIRSARAKAHGSGDASASSRIGRPSHIPAGGDDVANPSGGNSSNNSSGIYGAKVLGDKISATTATTTPPLMGKSPTPVSRKLDSMQHQGQPTQGVDLGSIIALDLFLLRTLGQLVFEAGSNPLGSGGTTYAGLDELIKQSREMSGKVLDLDLQYESTPSIDRKVSTVSSAGFTTEADADPERSEPELGRQERAEESTVQTQSGIVTVAHVIGGKQPRVAVCSGFAIGSSEMIVTCAHTLESVSEHIRLEKKLAQVSELTLGPLQLQISHNLDPSAPSVSLVLTSSGHIFPVLCLLSSLPSSDLVLLSIPLTPLRNPSYRIPPKPTDAFPRLRSLPVSPYPATVGTRIASLEYSSPLMGEGNRQVFRWKQGLVVEYRDSMGRTAETGTYDELSSLRFSSLPNPGSSGGPIVDVETGAVVGVVRGSTKAYGDREERGWGTPAEKIFESFKLPGFKSTSSHANKETRTVATAEGKLRVQQGKKISK